MSSTVKELLIDDWLIVVNEFEWIFHIYTKDEILNKVTSPNLKIRGSDCVIAHSIKNIKLVIEYE